MSTVITPYVFFTGRCEEALNFYKEELGAEIGMIMRFNESPEPAPAGMLPAGFENKIMHSEFRVGGASVMASDGCKEVGEFVGFRLSIIVDTESEARRMFNGLAKGGKTDMPLTKTFWSPCYGMVTDKFGLAWMVMVRGPAACA